MEPDDRCSWPVCFVLWILMAALGWGIAIGAAYGLVALLRLAGAA